MITTFSGLTTLEQVAIYFVLFCALLSFAYAWFLWKDVVKQDKGTPEMQEIWGFIQEGAESYLNTQLKKILPIIGILTIVLFLSVYIVEPSSGAYDEFGTGTINLGIEFKTATLITAIGRTVAFVMGASFSLIVGQLGMRVAIQANVRVAQAARTSYNKALTIAYRGGTFTGMLTDGLGLLGGTVIFIIFGLAAPDALLGFGFGGTLLALFMRVGGGIYTKAADVGADLVGKVEQDMPEDDPRNAAVIADLVGDNVGDCAGMAADIFESYEVTIVSTLILGLAIYAIDGNLIWIMFPLIVRAIGVISSMIGTFAVAYWGGDNAEHAMFKSYELSSGFTIVVTMILGVIYIAPHLGWELFDFGNMDGLVDGLKPAILIAAGVLLAASLNPLTSYFTASEKKPTQDVKKATRFGHATTILSGLGVGMESAVWATAAIIVSFIVSIFIYQGGLSYDSPNGLISVGTGTMVLYGIALVGIGMLSHTGNNVAMDSYGPISDNANGIGEVAGLEPDARQIMADLDAVGNTVKAITKGIAIASAVIAAVALFASYVTDVQHIDPTSLANGLRISEPSVFVGLLIGAALPWLFSSLIIASVNRAASKVVGEVREQFKDPAIMSGEKKPDYARVVAITTNFSQKELIWLTLLVISVPIIVGLVLQVEALGGFLAGIITSGLFLAVFMSNAGGAWDNAKKSIEDEPSDIANNTGKGSERHKASVTGDTVGDPLKDTAGPALNPMIKVVNLISLIIAPILVQYKWGVLDDFVKVILVVVVLLLTALSIYSIMMSKRDPEGELGQG